MKTRVSLLCLVAMLAFVVPPLLQAQPIFTSATPGGVWANNATWTPGGTPVAVNYPGSAANDGAATINMAGNYTGAAPAFPITSLTATIPATNIQTTGALRITGTFTAAGVSLGNVGPIPTQVVVDGTCTVSGTLTVGNNSELVINGPLTGGGQIVVAAGGTLTLGPAFNAGVLPASLIQSPMNGVMRTGSALAMNGNLTIGNPATLNLTGTLTVNNGFSLTHNSLTQGSLAGSGALQGQSITSSVILASGFNTTPPTSIIPAANIANPFNGRLVVLGNASINGTMQISPIGGLRLNGGALSLPIAPGQLLLNNTGASSLQANGTPSFIGSGTIQSDANTQVILGAGFNGGTLIGPNFTNSGISGALQTSSALSLSNGSVATPYAFSIANVAGAALNLGGTMTIGSGVSLAVLSAFPTAITGTGLQAVSTPSAGTLGLAAGALGGNIPSGSIISPFNGALVTSGAMALTSSMTMGAPSALSLGGNLSINAASLNLNMTGAQATSMPGPLAPTANFIVPTAAGSAVVIGSGAFNGGRVPYNKFSDGLTSGLFPIGSLVLNGATSLDPTIAPPDPVGLTMSMTSQFIVNGSFVVPTARNLTLNNTGTGALQGTGTIQGQDVFASIVFGAGFNAAGPTGLIPGNRFANPLRAYVQLNGSQNLQGSTPGPATTLVLDNTSQLNLQANILNVQAGASLGLNMLAGAPAGLSGAASAITGPAGSTLTFGPGALAGVFPATVVTSPAFAGRINVGANMAFSPTSGVTTYLVDMPTILGLDGPATVASGFSLGLRNTTANTLFGPGNLQGASNTATVAIANGVNGGLIPGAQLLSPFNGTLMTYGPATLSSALTMGMSGVLNLSEGTATPGNLTINSGVNLTLLNSTTGPPVFPLSGTGEIIGPVGSSVTLGAGFNGGTIPMDKFKDAINPPFPEFLGTLTLADGLTFGGGCPITYTGTLNLLGTATVPIGCRLNLANQNANALIGTGVLQGADNTASINLATNYNAGLVPGARFANPFNGTLMNQSPSTLVSNLTMGTGSIMNLASEFLVNSGVSLGLNGTSLAALQGAGKIQGQNASASVGLGANSNAGLVPVNQLSVPFNGRLIITAPLTIDQAMTIGNPGGLQLNANLMLAQLTNLTLNNTGANTLGGTGRFTDSNNTARIFLGAAMNGNSLPGVMFTGFRGNVSLNGALNLASSMILGPQGTFNFGGGNSTLTLGANEVSVSAVQGGTATSFFVTNGSGLVTLNNTALMPYVFHIGTTATAYSPLTLVNNGAADTFSARVAPGMTNLGFGYPDRVNLEWITRQGSAAGTKSALITPQWNQFDERSAFDRAQSLASHWTGTEYAFGPRGAATPVGGSSTFSRSTTVTVRLDSTRIVVLSLPAPPVVIPGPTFTATDPASIPAGVSDTTVFIRGTNFARDARVTFSYPPGISYRASTSNVFSNVLTVTIPGFARSAPRTITFSVTNGNAAPGTTGTLQISPVGPPVVRSISIAGTTATSTAATGQAFTAIINGSNFFTNFSYVTVEGTIFSADTTRRFTLPARPVGATTATQAFVEIPSLLNTTTSATIIRFFNPDGQSSQGTLQINGGAARPVIGSLQPNSTTAGVSSLRLTINGVNFFNDLTVRFSGQFVTVIERSPSRLVVQIPGSLLANPGLARLEVQNADGISVGTTFLISTQTPQGPAPVITSVTPLSTTASTRAFSVVIVGRNFSSGGVFTNTALGGQTILVDSTRIIAQIPPLSEAQLISVGITNPDGQATGATITVGQPLPAPTITGTVPPSSTTATGRAFAIIVNGSNFTQGVTAFWLDSLGRLIPIVVAQNSATSVTVNVPDSINGRPFGGPNRVVLVNADGQSVIFPFTIGGVSVRVPNPLAGVKAFPNPVSAELTIVTEFERPLTVQISLMNLVGQRVMFFTEQVPSGQYRKQLNLGGLPTGSYLLEVTDGTRRYVEQVVKY